MNGEELRAYTVLTHPAEPEDYRLSEDGERLYVLEHGCLVCLQGEGLDKMSVRKLYSWYLSAISDWRRHEGPHVPD